MPKHDDPLSFDEVERTILSLKDNKTAGPDNIPAEYDMVLSMVGVPCTEDSVILSLTAGPLNVSYRNEKMPTLFLHTSKMLTEQNVATVVASPYHHPYRYVRSSCHGWFSVLQLSCRSGSETRLCSSPNHLQPASKCYDSCISP